MHAEDDYDYDYDVGCYRADASKRKKGNYCEIFIFPQIKKSAFKLRANVNANAVLEPCGRFISCPTTRISVHKRTGQVDAQEFLNYPHPKRRPTPSHTAKAK